MRLRILGAHGGESSTHRASSFLVDNNLLLDAGAVTRSLTLNEQLELDYIFISHSHLDHIRDLALLCDNLIAEKKKPVELFCAPPTADALEKHIFNNSIWPDFTKIPNPVDPDGNPVIRINRMESGSTVKVGKYEVTSLAVNHPVDCQAHFIKGPDGTLVYSGDTGPTDLMWEKLNKTEDLKALIWEVSFPNFMKGLAEVSGHLTPEMMAEELKKFKPRNDVPVL
ncbi:3',5'-cyclic-nucleotide phosphodiesterase, partial [Myxococcota bacterium]|nr:3',5'-cyclic-nucleotide phosphodiesterase [Myxococcota bacterium]